MIIKSALLGAALAGSMLIAGAAQATVIFDTIQGNSFGTSVGDYGLMNENDPFMGNMSVSDALQFSSPENGDINTVTAFIGGQGQVTLGIVQDQNGAPSSSFLDSETVTLGNGPIVLSGLDWAVTNGGTYWLQAVASPNTDASWLMATSWGPVAQLQTFNGNSRLWSGNFYNPEATITATATSGVPEISTWAMMLAGFTGLGFVGYRRNKAASAAA